ncbi:MAG: 4-alpha-glucanotransferase [Verrucomicrobiae bacterium]|nr:4-alpha-glucanotransferase [Verrucomicrobiae bacterium]
MKDRDSATDAWGIQHGYRDVHGAWHPVGRGTRTRLRAAMGGDGPRSPEPGGVRRMRPGMRRVTGGSGWLRWEDGGEVELRRGERVDVPEGMHECLDVDGAHAGWWLAVGGGCDEAPPGTAWGWAAQLYAARSRRSWGHGDFGDLRRLGDMARGMGAGFTLLNPLGAPLPGRPQEDSPYSPSSRMFLNPLYLRIEDVPGAEEEGRFLEGLVTAGRALNERRRIDRDAVYGLKMRALERLWRRFRGDPRYDRYCREQGLVLRRFAVFNALSERWGGGWSRWPEACRRPDSAAVSRFADEEAPRVAFHQWLQWLLDEQLGRAATALPLMLDVPIGVGRDGFDAWLWQDVLALDVAVGVPPDEYNTQGQNWGLPPYIPHRLRRAGYGPWRQTLRAMLRQAGGLRVDHVMGLFRLYWIPGGASPADGGYVRYAADEMLAVLAIESRRAGAVVVGEDLGMVERGVRPRLRRANVLSYRLLWFERGRPETYPEEAMAAITTHDLFTVAGLWTGSDLKEQEALGLRPNGAGMRSIRRRVARWAGLGDGAGAGEAVVAAHRLLRGAPCRLLTATLDDALGVEERPNLPGTVHERPNWRLALPRPLEALERHPLVRAVAETMRGGVRNPSGGDSRRSTRTSASGGRGSPDRRGAREA